MMKRYPTALTIAGSDSGGCAGIQADLKTFSALGVFGASVITSITAQNTCEVRNVEVLSPRLVESQLRAVMEDITVDAVKTGMLPSAEIIEVVTGVLAEYGVPVIVDPVMVATSGARLTAASIADTFLSRLDRFSLITPNIPEAETLAGREIKSVDDMSAAAAVLLDRGCQAVLIKGGHLTASESTDILFRQGQSSVAFTSRHVDTKNLHGTGCTLSSAIAGYMALGNDLETAVSKAKDYITAAIVAGSQVKTGHGCGPVDHFFSPEPLKIIEL